MSLGGELRVNPKPDDVVVPLSTQGMSREVFAALPNDTKVLAPARHNIESAFDPLHIVVTDHQKATRPPGLLSYADHGIRSVEPVVCRASRARCAAAAS